MKSRAQAAEPTDIDPRITIISKWLLAVEQGGTIETMTNYYNTATFSAKDLARNDILSSARTYVGMYDILENYKATHAVTSTPSPTPTSATAALASAYTSLTSTFGNIGKLPSQVASGQLKKS